MNVGKAVLVILIFCSGFFSGYGFEKLDQDSLKKSAGDTNLMGFQHSRPGIGSYFYNQTLGNLGSAMRSVYFWDEEKEIFNARLNAFKVYEFSEEMNFVLPKGKFFSELQYMNGPKREQLFSIKHFQKLTNQFFLGFDFRSSHSDGAYRNQAANFRNFNAFAGFHTNMAPKSPKGDLRTDDELSKYSLLLNYRSSKVVSEENGGLANVSEFETGNGFDPKVADVNFDGVHNQAKSRMFYLKQRYNFMLHPSDPLKGETTTGDTLVNQEVKDSTNVLRNRFYLKHVFKYERRAALFTADQFYKSFFEHAYYDTTRTDDSLFTGDFFNELSLHVDDVSALKGKAAFYLAGNYQYFRFYQEDTVSVLSAVDTAMQNVSLKPGVSIEWKNGLGADFFYEKSFNDLNFEFYKAGTSFHYPLPPKGGILLKLALEKEMRNPDFVYSSYSSNHFKWNNEFKPIDFSKVEISAETKFSKQTLRFTAGLFSVKDLTYFDEEALPQQLNERVNVFNVGLNHSINFGKYQLINNLKYQHADNKDVVRLPDFSSYTSFFYSNYFFKRALNGQFGFDLRYCTLYFADAYMPATAQFYLQNENKIGNYVYVDVFANFRIKTFRFYLKMEHLNEGFTSKTYYTVPNYPMPGRSFKFGIKWEFFD